MTAAQEKPALLIIDMVKDYFDDGKKLPISSLAREIIKPLNHLIGVFRDHHWPVVFSTDAFNREDFIFTGRMHPHSLAGTEGADVIDELDKSEDDLWLPKPRFSAFFQTDLALWLHERRVTLCAVGGIAAHFCVLTSVMDALCHDFKAVMLEDCSAAYPAEVHEQTMDIYRRNPLYPLFRVLKSTELLEMLIDD